MCGRAACMLESDKQEAEQFRETIDVSVYQFTMHPLHVYLEVSPIEFSGTYCTPR